MKSIINIVGPPGSGKSRACEFLRDNYGYFLYRPSDVIRAFAAAQGIQLASREDYVGCHIQLVKADKDAMIRPVLESQAEKICLDGMRAPAPMERLRNRLGAISVFMACPETLRWQHVIADITRKDHRKPPTLEEFIADELADLQTDNPELPSMPLMEATADYVIDASRPISEVHKELSLLIPL